MLLQNICVFAILIAGFTMNVESVERGVQREETKEKCQKVTTEMEGLYKLEPTNRCIEACKKLGDMEACCIFKDHVPSPNPDGDCLCCRYCRGNTLSNPYNDINCEECVTIDGKRPTECGSP